jgi:Sec-independent protein translocase protein TatA
MLRSRSNLSSSIIFISFIDLLFIIIIIILYSYPKKNPETQSISPKLIRELGRVELKTQDILAQNIETLSKKTSKTNQEVVNELVTLTTSRLNTSESKSEGSLSAPYFKTIDSSIFYFAIVKCIHDPTTRNSTVSLQFQPDLSKLDQTNKARYEKMKEEYAKRYEEGTAISPQKFSKIFNRLSKEGSLVFIKHSWSKLPLLQSDVTIVMQEIDKCFTRVSGAAR